MKGFLAFSGFKYSHLESIVHRLDLLDRQVGGQHEAQLAQLVQLPQSIIEAGRGGVRPIFVALRDKRSVAQDQPQPGAQQALAKRKMISTNW